ncbi:hypothetical protein OA90_19610 [Labrenzia sp. OB1]|nr:hypothetical protein OA90_19610 [Labrenzia sp. OB1]
MSEFRSSYVSRTVSKDTAPAGPFAGSAAKFSLIRTFRCDPANEDRTSTVGSGISPDLLTHETGFGYMALAGSRSP